MSSLKEMLLFVKIWPCIQFSRKDFLEHFVKFNGSMPHPQRKLLRRLRSPPRTLLTGELLWIKSCGMKTGMWVQKIWTVPTSFEILWSKGYYICVSWNQESEQRCGTRCRMLLITYWMMKSGVEHLYFLYITRTRTWFVGLFRGNFFPHGGNCTEGVPPSEFVAITFHDCVELLGISGSS